MHHLLTGCWTFLHYRWDGICRCFIEPFSQKLRVTIQHSPHPLPTGQNADGYPGIRMALDTVKDHCRAFLGGPLYRSACPYVPINSRKLRHGVHRDICLQKLAGHCIQQCQGTAQIVYLHIVTLHRN